jgi:hypothetical protein
VTGPDEPINPDGQAGPVPRGRVSLEELADLDAGLLTEDEERQLRRRIANDPDAADLLAELEHLHTALGELHELDDEPVPDDVVARVDAALAAAAAPATDPKNTPAPPASDESQTAPVVDLAAARENGPVTRRGRSARPSRMRRFTVGALSVAAAAVVAVVVSGVIRDTAPPPPQPGSGPTDAVTLTVAGLPAQWPGITEFHDLGFLAAPGKLDRCLPPVTRGEEVLGARPAVVDGLYGVLVAVPNDPIGTSSDVRLVVLGPNCDVSRDVIAESVVPR